MTLVSTLSFRFTHVILNASKMPQTPLLSPGLAAAGVLYVFERVVSISYSTYQVLPAITTTSQFIISHIWQIFQSNSCLKVNQNS